MPTLNDWRKNNKPVTVCSHPIRTKQTKYRRCCKLNLADQQWLGQIVWSAISGVVIQSHAGALRTGVTRSQVVDRQQLCGGVDVHDRVIEQLLYAALRGVLVFV
jgi:hypothetical protein